MTKDQIKIYEEQLKPCPFCGKKATIYQDEWGFNLISCHNTDCPIEPCTTKRDIEQAVKDWNTRIISALSENKATSGEYISKADMERILYSTNNAVRIGEEFLELQTYSFPDSKSVIDKVLEVIKNERFKTYDYYASLAPSVGDSWREEYEADMEIYDGVIEAVELYRDSVSDNSNSAENKPEHEKLMNEIEANREKEVVIISAENDLISKQAVEKLVWEYLRKENDENIAFYEHFLDLPSVENKAVWIYDKGIENWRCSKCGQTPPPTGYVGKADFMATYFKFCPNCRADMQQTKSEDKTE